MERMDKLDIYIYDDDDDAVKKSPVSCTILLLERVPAQ